MQKNRRILAIDFGTSRIGFAISDPNKIIATPLGKIAGSNNLERSVTLVVDYINTMLKEKHYEIEAIVIGLPLKLDGKDSPMTEHVRAFATRLQSIVEWPIELFDERLSSVQAERMLISEVDMSRKKRKTVIDTIAATVILQNHLDRIRKE